MDILDISDREADMAADMEDRVDRADNMNYSHNMDRDKTYYIIIHNKNI
jgi:hypothetical protein